MKNKRNAHQLLDHLLYCTCMSKEQETQTVQLNVRISPEAKAALKLLALADNRKEGGEVERLIWAEVKRRERRKQ